MASIKSSDTSTARYLDDDVDEDQQKRSVLITNVPAGTKIEEIIIYFQKESNGGGEVDMAASKMLEDGKAVVVFEEEEVARHVLTKEHRFNDTLLQLELMKCADDMEVYSLVDAILDPSRFTVDLKELHNLLIKTQEKTGVNFLETCKGFVVAGTLEQIEKSCLFLSKYAKPPDPKRESSDNLENVQGNSDPLMDSDDGEKSLETIVLDVEPKLMHLLQKELNVLEEKYKMKINWKSNSGKAHLSPDGKDASLFDQGKEEFINLYQKEFQDLQERVLSFDAVKNIADLEKTTKEMMESFAVVIEKKGDEVLHIFGKGEDVPQVMQRLQVNFGKRRGRRPYRESGNDELPKPDTYAQAAMLPLSKTLDNGVVVSVHQGDITKVQVDIIVNAANENLVHGGGVAGAIVKRGGIQIQQESDALVREYGRVPVGQVANTGSGNLPCKRILHAVGPQWRVHGEEGSRRFILYACMKSFHIASKYRMSSIALPGISSGIYGVPKEICAERMFAAAEMFDAEAPSDNQLKDIRFVNIDTPTYEAFRGEFLKRYGMIKTDSVFGRNPDGSPFDRSREADDTKEYQGQANASEDPESKKRAEAALRRMNEQGNATEAANSRENRQEHGHLAKSPESKSNSDFKKGFEQKERKTKGSAHNIKAVTDNRPGDQRSIKGKEPSHGKDKTDKHGQRPEERGKNPDLKAKEEETEDKDKGREEKEETEKEKYEKEEEEKEKEEEEEKDNENEDDIENERMKEEKGKENEKKNQEDHLDLKNQPLEGKEQDELTKMFSNMGIHGNPPQSDGYRLLNVEKTETNENSDDTETTDPENKERASEKPKSFNSTMENGESDVKKDASRNLKMAGRGRGALRLAADFSVSKPGYAVREVSSEKADSHRYDTDVSESDREGPPGLSISQEGLKFAKTFTEDVQERESNQEEYNANARKKQLESESNDATDGVPFKKVKVDEREKNGEVSTEHEESKTKIDIEEYDNPAYDEDRKDVNDEKEIEEEEKNDMSGCDESGVSRKNENKNVDKQTNEENDASSSDSSSAECGGDGQVSVEDSNDERGVNDDQGTDKTLKDEGIALSANATDIKRPVVSKAERKSDNQSFEQDSKNKRNAASVKKTETKTPMDPQTERLGANKVGDPNSKGGHPPASKPSKHLDSNINASGESTEGVDPKKALNSNVELDGVGEYSDEVANEEGKPESTETTDLKNISDVSADAPSMNSFELLDMPKLDHGSSAADRRTSENSDGSSESIEIINYSEEDEFADSSPSKSTNKREGDNVHPSGPDIDRSQMGSGGPHREDRKHDADQEHEEKTPVLSVTEKNENDEEEDAATGSGGKGEKANSDEVRADQTPSAEDLSTDEDVTGLFKKADSSASIKDQDCGLCYEKLDSVQSVKICNHLVCQNCAVALKKTKLSNTCRICQKPAQIALQPLNGQMKTGTIEGSLPGYEGCETLYIDYEFSEGIQGPFHPNPGTPYDKLTRRTFLPKNEGGKEVLELLEKAFDAEVLFTVGKSSITGNDNQIIFNTDIDHKTNIGGGSTVGYPDPGYLDRVKEQLKAKGIE